MRIMFPALMAAMAALPLNADPLAFGAELKLQLGHNITRPVNYKRIEASFTTPRSWRYGAQVDLSIGKFQSFQSASPGAGLHLYRRLGESAAAGLYISAEDRRTVDEYFIGAEARMDFGALDAEGYVAQRGLIRGGSAGAAYGIDLGLDLGTASGTGGHAQLLAGYHGQKNRDFAYLGGAWDFGNGIRMELELGRNNAGETVAAAATRFRLGDGAMFHRRTFLAGSPAQ